MLGRKKKKNEGKSPGEGTEQEKRPLSDTPPTTTGREAGDTGAVESESTVIPPESESKLKNPHGPVKKSQETGDTVVAVTSKGPEEESAEQSKNRKEEKDSVDEVATGKKESKKESAQRKVAETKEKIAETKEKVDDLAARSRKPLDAISQKQQDLQSSADSLTSKVTQPLQDLQSKQQEGQSIIDTATSKLDSARQALDNKDTVFTSVVSGSTSSLTNAKGSLDSARQNIEQKQQEFGQTSDLIRQIKDRIAGGI